jgi:hypothetical protein
MVYCEPTPLLWGLSHVVVCMLALTARSLIQQISAHFTKRFKTCCLHGICGVFGLVVAEIEV